MATPRSCLQKFAVIFVLSAMLAGFAAAHHTTDNLHTDELRQTQQSGEQFQTTSTLSGLFSFIESPGSVFIGDTITIDHSLTPAIEERQVDASDTAVAVETYYCGENDDCSVNAIEEHEWVRDMSWRTGTGAIGNFGSGTTFHGEVDLTVDPIATFVSAFGQEERKNTPEGEYYTVIYVFDTSTNEVLSDVWSFDTPNEARARFSATYEPADVRERRSPAVSASDDGTVTGTVFFENRGGDMRSEMLIEMQVRPAGQGLLSVGGGGPGLLSFVREGVFCGLEDRPDVDTKSFSMLAGETLDIDFTAEVEPGQRYDVFFVTGTDCADRGGVPTGPYAGGEKAATVEVGDVGDDDGFPTELAVFAGILTLVVAGVVLLA